jgi:cephalosporin hydroxylase
MDANQIRNAVDTIIALMKSKEYVRALRLSESLCKSGLRINGAHYLRMLCLNAVGRHEEALVAAKMELDVDPGHQQALAEFRRLSAALKKPVPGVTDPGSRSYASSLDKQTLRSVQSACHNYSYKGVPMIKNPFDFALYPLVVWKIKPRTIIEVGSKSGGSAIWFGDMVTNFELNSHVYSIDIVRVESLVHPRVTFLEGDGRHLDDVLTNQMMQHIERPLLVIEDADHRYETSISVLTFFHQHLRHGEMIVIEDGIISDLSGDDSFNSGPHRAIKEHVGRHPGEYEIDAEIADFFGYNFTWCTNGFLRKR